MKTPLTFPKIAALALMSVSSGMTAEPTVITNSVGMRLARIEAGSFTMGQDGPASDYALSKHPVKFDDADWDEKPAHRVTITQAYYIGATEVTLGQYRQFMSAFRGTEGDSDSAVSGVSWEQAKAFCDWLSQKEGKVYRLPTEAEWEYACRAGTTALFNTGDALPDGFQAWYGETGFRGRYFKDGALPQPYRSGVKLSVRVAQTPPNAWGLYDMHGNVSEWCSDWYGLYEPGNQTDPLGRSEGDFRVIRGGSHSTFARLLRSANRAAWLPQAKSEKTGFRVVLGELPRGKALPPVPPPLNAQNVKQGDLKIGKRPQETPVFSGPKPFVKIAPDSFGPLFSSHNHSPSIAECPNGDLLAVWYSCVDEGGSELCNVASRLRLGAAEWEPASPFWDGADVNDHAPKVWWDGDKTLFHFARGRAENIVRTSADNGATWSKARLIEPVGEFGNQPLRLSDGTLVLGNDSRQVSLVFSRDGGQTWAFNDVQKRESDFRPGGKGVRYPGIHAPMVQLADGRIMALSRNDKPEDQEKFGFKTPASFSSDLGKLWAYEASEFPAISSVQRAAMIRLREGPILLCSFTDQWRDWKKRKGMSFKAADGTWFTGYGLFAALSFDEGKTWPVRRLVTPGGKPREVSGIDRVEFTLSDTMAEPCGYLAATQTRDGNVQLVTSKNHYVFNLAWLRQPNAAVPPKSPITNGTEWKNGRPIALPGAKRPKVESVFICRPETEWTYSHHASITVFKDRLLAIWSNGRTNEDDRGQRVLISTSQDFAHWAAPRALVDSVKDGNGGERVLTAAGFHEYGGILVAYFGNYGPNKEGTRLQAVTTTDGDNWSAVRDIGIPVNPNHGPQRAASGRLIISGNISFPWTDDPTGLTGWHMSGIYPAGLATTVKDDPASFWDVAKRQGWQAGLCEGSFYQTDDGVLHMLLRNAMAPQGADYRYRLWLTESGDNGASWSEPVETDFSDTNSKFHFGRLPDRRFYCVSNPIGGGRTPLVLSLSSDGQHFSQHFILGDAPYRKRREGAAKGGEYGYPHTLVHDGYLYAIISRQKEAVEVLRVALTELAAEKKTP